MRRFVLAAPLLLGGCLVGPDYHRPAAAAPARYKELAPPGWTEARPADAAPKGDWWVAFQDPLLDRLAPLVVTSNQSLLAAQAAYRQAVSLTDEARAGLYPTVSATASDTRSGSGAGGSGTLVNGNTTGGGSSRDITTYSVQGNASWEVDLWGRVRRLVASQRALAQASAADIANTTLSLQAQLASDVMDLRIADALIRLLDETVANDAKSLQITQNQYTAGVAARSDVITAQAQLDAARSAAVAAGVSRAQYEHAIAVLAGMPPAALTVAPEPILPAPPSIPVSVPATLLQRRPDIAAAERTMQAENEVIGEQIAAFYPVVSLSALFGYTGDPLSSLVSAANRVWSLGASATETLFEGGARTAAVAAARAAYDQSVDTYRQTVLTALQQVEDNLAALRILAQQSVIQDRAVAEAQAALTIALNEYRAGTQAYTAVVIAQNTLLIDQQTALTIQQNRLLAAVALIAALGGGWDAADIPTPRALNPIF